MSRSGDCEGSVRRVEELEVDLGHVALELLVGESETLARLDEVAHDAELSVQALLVCGVGALDVRHLGVDDRAVEQAHNGQHAAQVDRLRQRVYT